MHTASKNKTTGMKSGRQYQNNLNC